MFTEIARIVSRSRATLLADAAGTAALFLMLFAMLHIAGAA